MTMFPEELLNNCIATQSQIDAAMRRGKRVEVSGDYGELTAYLWLGIVYVTHLEIKPIAFK